MEKQRLIKLKVDLDKHIQHTITLFSGYHRLTKLEQNILGEIVKHYLVLKSATKDEELFNDNFMNSKFRAKLMEKFNLKAPQLTNYLKNLREKKVMKEENGITIIEQKFIPTQQLVFIFDYVNNDNG